MPLQSIQAVAHPAGNRVDLEWTLDPAADGVRVVRREGRYPQHPEDGVIVADATDPSVRDLNLHAERVYYYALFPYAGSPPVYEHDAHNRAYALVTAPNGYGAAMSGLLPAIYHRYDKDTQFLARFLQLAGGQLDQLHSFADFSRRLRRLEEAPAPLLPLLAQWIAWKTDYKRGLDSQRDEIRNASAIYRRTGLLPVLEATIRRINDWESRSKEYVHNVFASNRPPRLNLWMLHRKAGAWSGAETLQSLDYCYEGRATHAVDANGLRWLFYHTERQGRWEIWSKSTPAVALDISLIGELAAGPVSAAFWQALTGAGLVLTQTSQLNNIDTRVWKIVDGARSFIVEQEAAQLTVYDLNQNPPLELGASKPRIVNDSINKYPVATAQGDALWLFWTVYEPATGQWRLRLRRRENAQWSAEGPQSADTAAVNPFIESGSYDPARPRRRAFVTADDSGGVWLFWQEYSEGRWQLRYNRHDGAAWGEAVTLPPDGAADPDVQDDIMALVPAGSPARIYLFWARLRPVASAEGRRWQVALRMKSDRTLNAANWSAVKTLPKASVDDHHDREPFALIDGGGQLELFWSSSREDSGWSIWHSTLQNFATNNWSPAARITEPVCQQRAPLPVPLGAGSGLALYFRSNRKYVYESRIYRATEIHDERYGGSFTTDQRHHRLIGLRDSFDDPQRYTYDTGTGGVRDDSDRIARDTIGAFVDTDTLSDSEMEQGVARLRGVVKEFMPITDRAVFIADKTLHAGYVYDYARPYTPAPRYIHSSYIDEWSSAIEESALAEDEDFSAELES